MAHPQATPNQELLKTDLLVVTAHPDDESMMAATIARYAEQGKVVSLVVCTRGEGGGNSTGKELGAALGIVREAELRRCLAVLGVKYLYFLDQQDWAYTESVQATLRKWGREVTLQRLVRLVRLLRPDIICTLDPTPTGGQHGHHQAAGRAATEAFSAAADPTRFPAQYRDEGLAPWKAKKLYWVSFTGGSLLLTPEPRHAERAAQAEALHRSQGFDKFFGPRITGQPNRFTLIKARVPLSPSESDLFDGTTAPAGKDQRVRGGVATVVAQPPLALSFQPLPAWRNFDAWLAHNNLAERIIRPLPTSALTAGLPSRVVVEVTNQTAARQPLEAGLTVPRGWVAPPPQQLVVAPRQTVLVAFPVTPPAETPQGPYPFAAAVGHGTSVWGLSDDLTVLPSTRVTLLRGSLPLAPDPVLWQRRRIAPLLIPYTYAAQGTVRDNSELSGQVYLGYDAHGLQALIDVTDDLVTTHIAPDDIKAHWRTTSVELCLDPQPRSEDTFSTLKLGIFPQDTTGRVRACRDADANPGPIDRVEPGIQLVSRRTRTGYTIAVRIPWAVLKVTPQPGRILGGNVILYHAGKKPSRPGEDVGKSRLAWSYGPGVWGRPEIWGSLVLG